MKNRNKIDLTKVKWSRPMGQKELSQIFEVHRSTIAKWLKNQVIRNRRLSRQRWQVATFEFPYKFMRDKVSDIDKHSTT